jgi:hypothetical protein
MRLPLGRAPGDGINDCRESFEQSQPPPVNGWTAPGVTHAAILFNPDTTPYAIPAAKAAESAAPGLSTKAQTIAVCGPKQLREVIARVASEPGGGLISRLTLTQRTTDFGPDAV